MSGAESEGRANFSAFDEADGATFDDAAFAERTAFKSRRTRESRALAVWEILSIVTTTVICEWAVLALADRRKALLYVPIACAFALMLYSHYLRGETLRELGWRTDNFARAARSLVVPMACGALLLALVGWLWFGGSFTFGKRRAGWSVFGFPVWGLVWGLLQQYVLQAFINRRAQLIFGRGAMSIILVALLFALLHLPNPWLMGATFVGGLIWASVYQRAPNLYALALSHAFMTWVLISTLPINALNGLRVGYKFFG
ncbi:MAG TPA: CPBP family intramembrane glutamic endopeptidase [Pyrinomonadaceae bacterium]|nr:CPBP family intramembrane glutamic endopeptidase [Pyrinomonadaceae bacterium]